VDYHCAPLLPHQICILDTKASFAPAINKVINEYFPLDLAASIRQYQYFKDTKYAIQDVRQKLCDKEYAYEDRANDVLTGLENANVLGRLMAHLDILHTAMEDGDDEAAYHHFSRAVRGFTQPVTQSATNTCINPFLSPPDPRKDRYQGPIIPDGPVLRDDSRKHALPWWERPRWIYSRPPCSTAQRTSFTRKRCHKCHKWGHIRATCPSRRLPSRK
jgi:hypothetical protein